MHIETFLTKNAIVSNQELNEMMEHNNIMNTLELDDDINLITFIPINEKENDNNDELFNNMTNFNISIPLSAAITAYARIHMSKFKDPNNTYDLYYSDTDCVAIDQPLPDSEISKELGAMKLEYIFDQAVYISPKVYGGITSTGHEIIKVKGYKNSSKLFKDRLDFKTLESLLYLEHDNVIKEIELTHDKWNRNFELGLITIKEQLYTLRVTQNKREFVIENNKIVDTKPYTIKNNNIIIP